ncbi:hypothetical protein [Verrucosispora sp. WMMC514]|uniref:hypothetical protein n=1 Tax=Verrucosispora sp. WMMC514 TaxID=3015156 RepID=UPI00248CDBBF|nr:hypothetical protein [Verrucosispora sp. WMMC514]WBB89882.1 hypothetical protein O7597_23270 [Verrucosispora sp. WMMC514]
MSAEGATLSSAQCGACPRCRVGDPAHCTSTTTARTDRNGPPVASAPLLLDAISVVDMVLVSGMPLGAVQVRTQDRRRAAAVCDLVRTVVADVLPGEASRDEWIARGRPGRADVVIDLDGDLAWAAATVRRGGAAGVPGIARTMPTPTTIVQREIRLLQRRDLMSAWELLAAGLIGRDAS